LPFALFVTCSFFADAPVKALAGALFFNWLVFGGYLLSPPIAGLILPLAVWHRRARMTAAGRARERRLAPAARIAGSPA
jgi:hypothetical protein